MTVAPATICQTCRYYKRYECPPEAFMTIQLSDEPVVCDKHTLVGSYVQKFYIKYPYIPYREVLDLVIRGYEERGDAHKYFEMVVQSWELDQYRK